MIEEQHSNFQFLGQLKKKKTKGKLEDKTQEKARTSKTHEE